MAKLFIICGLSFSGKSTLGEAIASRLHPERVDVDETKKILYGADIADDTLTQDDWGKIYAETDRLIVEHLRKGRSVVDDSRNFRKAERRHIRECVHHLNPDIVTIYVDTPEKIARKRMVQNRSTRVRADRSDADFDEIVRVMEPPDADEMPLGFPYDSDIDAWILRHLVDEG